MGPCTAGFEHLATPGLSRTLVRLLGRHSKLDQGVVVKQFINNSLVGGIVGGLVCGALIVLFVIFGKLDALRTIDALTFAFVVLGVVITALTVVGSFTLINTWNDIDKRTKAIVEKYEQDAKTEIERNAAERQRAIDETGNRTIATANQLTHQLQSRNKLLMIRTLGLFSAYFALSLWIQSRARKRG